MKQGKCGEKSAALTITSLVAAPCPRGFMLALLFDLVWAGLGQQFEVGFRGRGDPINSINLLKYSSSYFTDRWGVIRSP